MLLCCSAFASLDQKSPWGGREEGKKREKGGGERNRGGKERGGGMGFMGVEESGYGGGNEMIIQTKLDRHECFQFFISWKRTNNSNNATDYVKLGKKKRKSSKRNYYILSPRVVIKAIIIIKL